MRAAVRARPSDTPVDRRLVALALVLAALSLLMIAFNIGVSIAVGRFGQQFLPTLVTAISLAVVGGVIASRRPRELIGWLLLFAAFTQALVEFSGAYSHLASDDGFQLPAAYLFTWLSRWMWMPGLGVMVTFLVLLFPDGRLPSPRWRWVAAVSGVALVVPILILAITALSVSGPTLARSQGPPSGSLAAKIFGPSMLLVAACAVASFGSLLFRFRQSGPQARHQLKWFLFGVVLLVAVAVSSFIPGTTSGNAAVGVKVVTSIAVLGLPVSIGIAVLRYRLYDIDVVINRTVVYGAATAFLVLAFAALSELSTLVIEKLTGRSSGIMTIPLIVAAALSFSPLQRRIRPIVDRMLPPRSVLTILMTDVANSTDKAVEMGDTRWRETLAAYRSTVRQGLRRFKGSEMDTAGDGFFAVFDRAADALRAAEWCRTTLHQAGLDSRFGLHAGECETRGEKVSGVAVITAARVMAQAQANQILVTAAGRDALSEDLGDSFADRGLHALKGLPGQFQLYEVMLARPIGLQRRSAQ